MTFSKEAFRNGWPRWSVEISNSFRAVGICTFVWPPSKFFPFSYQRLQSQEHIRILRRAVLSQLATLVGTSHVTPLIQLYTKIISGFPLETLPFLHPLPSFPKLRAECCCIISGIICKLKKIITLLYGAQSRALGCSSTGPTFDPWQLHIHGGSQPSISAVSGDWTSFSFFASGDSACMR